eukprot:6497973-Ditylum_brightwellii.AAC.1
MRVIYILTYMPHLSSSIGFSSLMLGFASHAYLPVRALAHSTLFCLVCLSSVDQPSSSRHLADQIKPILGLSSA